MEIRIKNAAGAVMFLSGFPAMAQEAAALKATVVAACASCPPTASAVPTPGDPTWFIAGALVGAGLGYLAARVFGAKQR